MPQDPFRPEIPHRVRVRCEGSGKRPLAIRTIDATLFGICPECQAVRRLRMDGRLWRHWQQGYDKPTGIYGTCEIYRRL